MHRLGWWIGPGRSWRLRRQGEPLKAATDPKPYLPNGLPARVEKDRQERQSTADDDTGSGVEAEQRDDVDGEREEERAERGADKGAAAAGEGGAAKHRGGDAGEGVTGADRCLANADLRSEEEAGEG